MKAVTVDGFTAVEVVDYKLFTGAGRYIKLASKVIFSDGVSVAFLDRLTKKYAIAQAVYRRSKGVV